MQKELWAGSNQKFISNEEKKMDSKTIMGLFFYRRNPFAIKTDKGYIPIYRDVTIHDIQKHMIGDHTIGAYQSRSDETCMWACIDFDLKKYNDTAMDIFQDYRDESPLKKCLLEESISKGYHVWFFFDEPKKTEDIYNFLISVLKAYDLSPGKKSKIDIFPRSPHLTGKKIGSMVRIPRY